MYRNSFKQLYYKIDFFSFENIRYSLFNLSTILIILVIIFFIIGFFLLTKSDLIFLRNNKKAKKVNSQINMHAAVEAYAVDLIKRYKSNK